MRCTWIIGMWLVSVLLAPAKLVRAYEVISVSDGGSIAGTVKFQGARPVLEPLKISKDEAVCGQTEKVDETLIIDANQGVQNAVVSLVNIQRGKKFPVTNVVLDQKDCRYAPHVLLVPAMHEISILNSDGILHNSRTHSSKNPPLNQAQPKFKKIIKEVFQFPEVIQITCDAHAWMKGWLIIVEHPYYAVTDAWGHFQLEDVPSGDYEVKVWHESLQEKTQHLRVMPRTRTTLNMELP